MRLLLKSGTLCTQAQANTLKQFTLGDFQGELSRVAVQDPTTYSAVVMQVLGDRAKKEALAALVVNPVYDGLRQGEAPH